MLLAAGQSLSRALPRAARLHAAAARRNDQAQAQPSGRPAAKRKTDTVRPSVVLGTRPHEEETLWKKCDLALCLVNPSVLNGPPPSTVYQEVQVPEFDTIHIPTDTSYGVGPVEKQMLFHELPRLTTQAPMHRADSPFTRVFNSQLPQITSEDMQDRDKKATKAEAAKVAAFSRVVDLRNANAKGIAYENRRRIILAFSGPKNPFDPGRAEVQAAILTYEIRNLWNHLTTFKRDVGNRRGLRQLVHQRAKILKYIKNKSRDRYEAVLPRLALEPAAVEGELVV